MITLDPSNLPIEVAIMATILYSLMQALKKFLGFSDKTAAIMIIVLGCVMGIINQLVVVYPSLQPFYDKFIWGLVAGLVAAGVYSIQSTLRKPQR